MRDKAISQPGAAGKPHSRKSCAKLMIYLANLIYANLIRARVALPQKLSSYKTWVPTRAELPQASQWFDGHKRPRGDTARCYGEC